MEMTTQGSDNGKRTPEAEGGVKPTEAPACGTGCGCGTSSGNGCKNLKIAVCIAVLIAVCAILFFKTTNARQNAACGGQPGIPVQTSMPAKGCCPTGDNVVAGPCK
jgi:hypothetical protein